MELKKDSKLMIFIKLWKKTIKIIKEVWETMNLEELFKEYKFYEHKIIETNKKIEQEKNKQKQLEKEIELEKIDWGYLIMILYRQDYFKILLKGEKRRDFTISNLFKNQVKKSWWETKWMIYVNIRFLTIKRLRRFMNGNQKLYEL